MKDKLGRDIDYLRISLTDRCNLSCIYCKGNSEHKKELSVADIERIVKVFALCGIKKVRLTGGEPLLRDDIAEIIRRIKSIDGIKKIVLTTNGILLKKYAKVLKDAGLSAVNISLDTTDERQYLELTGADKLKDVFEGIKQAQKVGLSPIRINSVLIKGKNDSSAEELVNLARDNEIDVRFIELMPFTEEGQNEEKIVKGDEILSQFPLLIPTESKAEKSVARYFTADGFKGRIGLITPVSNKFCSECNRIRLLSDGKVRPCLGDGKEVDLMPIIDDKEKLLEAIKETIFNKPANHSFSCDYGKFHSMNQIGG
ncbi:MAG: GTP 3',8-cyclase MoaA [Acutalibacteraceae bacterium]|nr:GTP 3',8-cyclase MoaA [Acutalibacteraceae bacterium]